MKTVTEQHTQVSQIQRQQEGLANDQFFEGIADSESFFGPSVQTKLSVGAPDDIYEKEADHVADQLIAQPSEPSTLQAESNPETNFLGVQRKPLFGQISRLIPSQFKRKSYTPNIQKQEEEESIQTLSLIHI